jgi:DoxX-like family
MRLPSEPGGASGPTAAKSPKPTAWAGVRAVLAFTRVLGGLAGRPGKQVSLIAHSVRRIPENQPLSLVKTMNAEKASQFVQASTFVPPVSKARLWIGWILTALPALFLLMDGVMKVMKPDFVVKATVEMGYPEDVIFGLGIVVLICVVLYIVPNTAVLGAILLTGYLGGAVATHVRHGDPLVSHVLAPVYFAILLWGGLYLREPRLSALIPLRK